MISVMTALLLAASVKAPAEFQMPFRASDTASARELQETVRARLLAIVEAQNSKKDVPLEVKIGEFVEKDGYRQADVPSSTNIFAISTKPLYNPNESISKPTTQAWIQRHRWLTVLGTPWPASRTGKKRS